jgi:putative SOS response-associated peptidase YedK
MGDIGLRYNIAPTQTVRAVRRIEQGARWELAKLYRGLIPSWAKDSKMGDQCASGSEKPKLPHRAINKRSTRSSTNWEARQWIKQLQ